MSFVIYEIAFQYTSNRIDVDVQVDLKMKVEEYRDEFGLDDADAVEEIFFARDEEDEGGFRVLHLGELSKHQFKLIAGRLGALVTRDLHSQWEAELLHKIRLQPETINHTKNIP